MDIKEPKDRTPRPTLILDNHSPTAMALAAAAAGAAKEKAIGPDHAWPDGKSRPHLVKTRAGDKVWLTTEEYDRLVLEARHQRRANPIGPRKQPTSGLVAGDSVIVYRLDEEGFWHGSIDRTKPDGRVKINLGTNQTRTMAIGKSYRVAHVQPDDLVVPPESIDKVMDFVVTSAWHGGARLRLATAADINRAADPDPAPAIESIADRLYGAKIQPNDDLTPAQRARQRRKANYAKAREQEKLDRKFAPVKSPAYPTEAA